MDEKEKEFRKAKKMIDEICSYLEEKAKLQKKSTKKQS